MENTKYTKLAKNTIIFAVGNFGTKIITFLIVPLYTYVLTTEEYGRIDLFSTSLSFMVPIITLTVHESLIRYLLGKEIDENIVMSNCWFVYLFGSFISLCISPIYMIYFKDICQVIIFTVLLISNSFTTIFAQYLRATNRNVAYTLLGVIGTGILVFSNVFFLVILKFGMMGYLYSMVLSQIVQVIYLILVGKIWKKLNFKALNNKLLKKMLSFSIPLIPNSLMWWIMSAGDKYIINYYLGDGANGIYSLALKAPTVISFLFSFFCQAWQLSAIEENKEGGKKQFYEAIYKMTNVVLFGMVACIILGIKPLYVLVMSESFAPAWMYVPLLAIATAFSCEATFLGVVYITSEKTSKAFNTTALGAIINIILNFLLIKPLGLQGVAIGTCFGYIVVILVRARDVKKEIKMSFDIRRTLQSISIVFVQGIITITCGNVWIVAIGCASIVLLLLIYRKEIIAIASKIFQLPYKR